MIQVNELRYGNLVYYKVQWNDLIIAPIYHIHGEMDMTHFEPIPLSPEILEKAGFVGKYKSVGYSFFKNGLRLYNQDVDDYGGEIPDYKFHVTPDCFPHESATIYYVHQLQNLYHSLTGEELNINL